MNVYLDGLLLCFRQLRTNEKDDSDEWEARCSHQLKWSRRLLVCYYCVGRGARGGYKPGDDIRISRLTAQAVPPSDRDVSRIDSGASDRDKEIGSKPGCFQCAGATSLHILQPSRTLSYSFQFYPPSLSLSWSITRSCWCCYKFLTVKSPAWK